MAATSARPRLSLAPLLVLSWLAAAGPLHAQGSLLDQGIELFNQGEFERSHQLLRRAQPSVRGARDLGRLHLYLGLDLAFLGKTARARQAFLLALEHDPTLDLDPARIKESVVKLFRQVRDGLRGELQVAVRGGGATVFVDGQELGPAPLTRTLPIGPHRVEVRSPAGNRRATLVIQRGKTTVLRIHLPPRPPDASALVGRLQVATRPRGAAVWVDGQQVGVSPTTVERLETGEHDVEARLEGRASIRRKVFVEAGATARVELELVRAAGRDRDGVTPARRRIWTWVAGGGALLFAGIGIGLWRAGVADYELYQVTNDPSLFRQLEESIPKKYIAADVMFGLAGALAATSVVLFFVEGRPRAAASRARGAGLALSPTLGGMRLDARF